jgi:hypothetical protein
MASFQCPNCQCEVLLTDASAKRLAAGAAWFCLGGFLAAVAAGATLPHVGPKAPDADWAAQVREAHKDDPGKADELIRQRQADDEQDWRKRMTPVERGVFETKALVRAAGILALCMGIPAAILALSIKPNAVQKRPAKQVE